MLAGAFDVFQFPHDSNLTCNFLMQIILKLDRIPKTFYLQLDNCWRENKNRFLFAFIGLMVEKMMFDQAYICFLMKGHTHEVNLRFIKYVFNVILELIFFEDIDQVFSKYSDDHLKKNDVFTISG